MYDKFTGRARKVLQLANREALHFNHEYIGTEHALMALVKEGTGTAAQVLKSRDLDLRQIWLEVEKLIESGPEQITITKLPQTPRLKRVIEFGVQEAQTLNHNYVGTEHLLLGLLREKEGVAAVVLMNLGLELEEIRIEVLDFLKESPSDELRDEQLIGSTRSGSTRTRKLTPSISGPGTSIALRMFGQELDPAEVTALLGVAPTSSCKKGDPFPGSDLPICEQTGRWFFVKDKIKGSVDQAVRDFLALFSDNLSIWNSLCNRFEVDLCFAIKLGDQRKFDLKHKTIQMLLDRQLDLAFDFS
jgi:hypothetical protein